MKLPGLAIANPEEKWRGHLSHPAPGPEYTETRNTGNIEKWVMG